ncbi:MAG: FeoA family protein [Spirochaetota bacterium]|nr:FeoA family protein [Spirochaetota bacterium]
MKHLHELAENSRARITGFEEGSNSYRSKLFSLGLTQGSEIIVRRVAPLGDPVEVEVRGGMASLRKREAQVILVEEVDS